MLFSPLNIWTFASCLRTSISFMHSSLDNTSALKYFLSHLRRALCNRRNYVHILSVASTLYIHCAQLCLMISYIPTCSRHHFSNLNIRSLFSFASPGSNFIGTWSEVGLYTGCVVAKLIYFPNPCRQAPYLNLPNTDLLSYWTMYSSTPSLVLQQEPRITINSLNRLLSRTFKSPFSFPPKTLLHWNLLQ